MKLHQTIVGTLAILLIPAGALATRPVVKYQEVKGPFRTMEEAETACMRAVGLNNETIRIYTGDISSMQRVENPIRFLVRRCLNNVKKEEENRILAENRRGRKQRRIDRVIAPQSRAKIEQNNRTIRNRTYKNVRTRATQHIRTARENEKKHTNARSLRRKDIRARERNMRDKLDRKKTLQEEARIACLHLRGSQRVMCIRQEVRDREEALYNE
jgi:hypothetical protein